jgi:IstB-like ATP binding protein
MPSCTTFFDFDLILHLAVILPSSSQAASFCGAQVAACRQKRRVRFATAAALINELVEAKHQLQLGRALARLARYDLIALDEVGYVPLAEVGAEFLFQVIAERAEQAAVIVTTNLPFSEWTQVRFPTRACARPWSTGLPTARTSLRPAPSPTASAERSRSAKPATQRSK